MVAEAELDALVIAAPTTAHLDLALAAIERGIAILVEKPLAGTVDEALRIVTAARARGVPVQVGHVERFNPAVLELGRLLAAGWLSTVYGISSRRAGPFPARIRDVGVTVDLATHDVDILSWIAGERPTRVYAETAQRIHATHEDLLFGLLHFPSGVVAQLDVDWLTPAKRRQLTVVGEEGMFELDYLTQRLTFTKSAGLDRPRLIDGYAPTFEGDVAVLPVEQRRAAGRRARGVPRGGPARRASDRRRSRTGCGRWGSPTPSSRPPPPGRRPTCPTCPRGSRSDDHHQPPLRRRPEPARRLDRAQRATLPPRRATDRGAVVR